MFEVLMKSLAFLIYKDTFKPQKYRSFIILEIKKARSFPLFRGLGPWAYADQWCTQDFFSGGFNEFS
jgi:hypothetical protein